MWRNYIKVAFRTLWRNKLHTTINVIGLAIGISACITIFQIVAYEYSFDNFHEDRDRIYRVYTEFSGVYQGKNPGVCAPLPAAITASVTGVETVAPLHTVYRPKVVAHPTATNRKTFKEQKGVVFVTPDFFDVFSSYDWLVGSPESALSHPNQVVLTASKAKHYFGVEDLTTLVGEELLYLDSLSFFVTGIVDDLETPTDLTFTDFIAFSSIKSNQLEAAFNMNAWDNFNSSSQLFIKKMEGVTNDQLTTQFDALLAQNEPTEEADDGWITNFKLQALTDLHFNSELGLYDRKAANHYTLYALIGIGIILLLLASINFINLATAQSLQRSKEIGVRKVIGGNRKALIAQFLSETMLLVTVATIIAIGLSSLQFQYFQEFLPEGLSFQIFTPSTLAFLFLTILIVSVLAGFYPAFVLSSFLPVVALKQRIINSKGGDSNNWLRKVLIVVQFSVSLVLITGTLIIGQQIHYWLNKDLGFDQEAIVHFRTSWKYPPEKKQLLVAELYQLPAIEQISLHSSPPSQEGFMGSNFEFEVNGAMETHHIYRKIIDENYLDLYGIDLVAGRSVQPSDTVREFVINEQMVELMGLTTAEEAIGKTLQWGESRYPIVGVTKNFHHQDLRQSITPLVMNAHQRTFALSLKLKTLEAQQTMESVAEIWKEIYPEASFSYQFFDEAIANFYETEQRIAKLMQTATGIVIFISCIGLFGLVSFAVARRTREIGIRKVLGASVSSIVALLSKDFIQLVFLAFLIAAPIAYYLMHQWLQDFAYRIELRWWVFALAGLMAVGIALLTVSFQSVKAALADPVESLRSE